MLLGDELGLFVRDLLLHLGLEGAVLHLLAEVANLVVVDAGKRLIGEPSLVFCALWRRFPAGHHFGTERQVEVCLVGVHDELAVVLGVFGGHLVEASVHVHLTKIEGLAQHLGAVHQREVAPLSLVEVQHGAIGGRDGSLQTHLALLVSAVGVVRAVLPFGRNRDVWLVRWGLRFAFCGRGRGSLLGAGFPASKGQHECCAEGPNHGSFHSVSFHGDRHRPARQRI